MRCPTCEHGAGSDANVCPAGHALADEAGVIRLLPAGLRAEVDALEADVTIWRREQGRRPLPGGALRELPFGAAVVGDAEWKLRRADLRLIRQLLAGRRAPRGGPLRVLDVGAWNGWLSACLAHDGRAATALDLFAGPEALGARHHFPGTWRAVQADPMDPSALGERFDVIVLDRCLAFQPDPVGAVQAAMAVSDADGLVIATGIAIHGDPELVAMRLAAEGLTFRARFGRELLLRPTTGVLDPTAIAGLESLGMRFRDHPFLRIANLRARVDGSRPRHRYGLMEVSG